MGQKGTPGHRDAAPSLPATRNAPATNVGCDGRRQHCPAACVHVAVKWAVTPSMAQVQWATDTLRGTPLAGGLGGGAFFGRTTPTVCVTHIPHGQTREWPSRCDAFVLATMQGAIGTGYHIADGDSSFTAWGERAIRLGISGGAPHSTAGRGDVKGAGSARLPVANGGLLRLLVYGWRRKRDCTIESTRSRKEAVGILHMHNDGGYDRVARNVARQSAYTFALHQYVFVAHFAVPCAVKSSAHSHHHQQRCVFAGMMRRSRNVDCARWGHAPPHRRSCVCLWAILTRLAVQLGPFLGGPCSPVVSFVPAMAMGHRPPCTRRLCGALGRGRSWEIVCPGAVGCQSATVKRCLPALAF